MKGIIRLIKGKMLTNKKQYFLTIIALSLGIALLVSLQSGIDNTKNRFKDMMTKSVADADIVIADSSGGFIKDDIEFLENIDNVEKCLPRILLRSIAECKDEHYNINVVGMLIEEEEKTGTINISNGKIPNDSEILIPDNMAKQFDLSIGDSFDILFEGGTKKFTISGIIKSDSAVSYQNGIVCVIPLETAREISGKSTATIVNIILNDPVERDEVLDIINQKIDGSTIAYFPEQKNEYFIESFKGFFLGLNIFSLVAIVAAAFIIYNTISKFVIDNKGDIALLKVMGASQRSIFAFVNLQTLFITIISLIIGIVLGILMTSIITNVVMISAAGVSYSSWKLLEIDKLIKDIFLVVFITFFATIFPSIYAVRVTINEGLTSASAKSESVHKKLFNILLAISTIYLLILINIDNKSSIKAYQLILTIIIIAYSLLYVVLEPITEFLLKIIGLFKNAYLHSLTRQNIIGRKKRNVSTIFANSICIGLAVIIIGISSGFKVTLSDWLDSMNPGDIMVYSRIGISDEEYEKISQYSFIDKISKNYSVNCYNNEKGFEYIVQNLDREKLESESFRKHISEDVSSDFLSSDCIIVSKNMAKKVGAETGDKITFDTSVGKKEMKIVGIADSFVTDEMNCYMSTNNFEKYYSELKPKFASIELNDDIDSQKAIDTLSEEFPNIEFTLMADEIAAQKRSISDNMFTAFYVLVFVALIINFLCITNSMNMFIIEKEYQLSILKSLGISKKQLNKIVYTQGIIMGSISIIFGIILGIAFQFVAIQITETITGWKIDLIFSPIKLFFIAILGIVISMLSCISPAKKGYKLSTIDKLRRGQSN